MKYKDSFDHFFILTDSPQYYKFLGEIVNIIVVSKEQISNWIGPQNYIFNVKIKGIEYFNKLYPNKNILFVDSDTFFYNHPNKLKIYLQERSFIMHENEGTFEANMKRSQTARRVFLKLAKLDLGEYTITQSTCMYNSGVLGLVSGNLPLILKEVEILTNKLNSANLRVHYTEQLAFSLVLGKDKQLNSASEIVGHYFGNKKEWNDTIKTFLAEYYVSNLSIAEIIDKMVLIDYDIPISRKKSK